MLKKYFKGMLHRNVFYFFVLSVFSLQALAQQNPEDRTLDLKPIEATAKQKPLLSSSVLLLEATTYPVADPRGKIVPIKITLKNNYSMVDTLEKITPDSKIAESAVLFQSQIRDEKRSEREIKSVVLNQGVTITLAYENMLFIGLKGVKAPLKNGDSFVLKFEFGRSSPAEILVQVVAPPALQPETKKAPSPIKAGPKSQAPEKNSQAPTSQNGIR